MTKSVKNCDALFLLGDIAVKIDSTDVVRNTYP